MLPNDITRCAGRRDLTPDTEICPVRGTCERFIANQPDADEPILVPVAMWLCASDAFERRIPTLEH